MCEAEADSEKSAGWSQFNLNHRSWTRWSGPVFPSPSSPFISPSFYHFHHSLSLRVCFFLNKSSSTDLPDMSLSKSVQEEINLLQFQAKEPAQIEPQNWTSIHRECQYKVHFILLTKFFETFFFDEFPKIVRINQSEPSLQLGHLIWTKLTFCPFIEANFFVTPKHQWFLPWWLHIKVTKQF